MLKTADSASSFVTSSIGFETQALGSAGRVKADPLPYGLAGLQGEDNQLCWLDSFSEEDGQAGSSSIGSLGFANPDGERVVNL